MWFRLLRVVYVPILHHFVDRDWISTVDFGLGFTD